MCGSLIGDVNETESVTNNELSSLNDIKFVSFVDFIVFVVLIRLLLFRCIAWGGGANEQLLDEVGNELPKPYDVVDDTFPNEPGRGRVVERLLTILCADVKLLCAAGNLQIWNIFKKIFLLTFGFSLTRTYKLTI